jgi:hypothetical protein
MLIPSERCSAWSAVLAALAVLSLPALCAAQTSVARASLVVTRGDGAQACPDAATLAAQVRGVAGANVIGVGLGATPTEPVATWVQVAVAHDFGGYRAQISTLGRHHGTRILEDLGPGCSSLADAIAVTIAIFLDPYADAPPPAQVTAASAPATPSTPKPEPRKAAPSRPEPFADASGGVASFLEHSEPLLGASLGLLWADRWSLALAGSYVFSDSVLPSSKQTHGMIRLRLSYGSVQGCGRVLGVREGARIDWCLAPLVGLLKGESQGYDSNSSKALFWLAVAAGPQAVFPFGAGFSGVLTAQAVLPLIRRGFDQSVPAQPSAVFTPAAVAGLISFGIRGAL